MPVPYWEFQDNATPLDSAIEAAILEARKSPCLSKRGASVWLGTKVMGAAHNSKPFPFVCSQTPECKKSCGKEAVHAEERVIINNICSGMDMLHVKVVDGLLVPSGPPSCLQCATMILDAKIWGMWLYHARPDGTTFWRRYNPIYFYTASVS